MPHVGVNGVELYYEEHGAGPPILCVHGTGSSAVLWGGAVATLARRARAIVYDRRGSSRSDRPEPYATSLAEQAEDAAALMAALEAWPAIVMGRSYGADVAVELALRHPERVRALVLMEGAEAVTAAGRRWLAELSATVLAAADDGPDAAAETLLREVLGAEGLERLPDEVVAIFVANGPAIVAELRGGSLDAGPERLAAVPHPVLVVTGEASPPVYAEAAAALVAAMPAARLARVEGGHIVDPAHPAVLAFVDEMLAAA